ncbi:hypothetical protein VB005_00202 [Metarhizium brunneum]
MSVLSKQVLMPRGNCLAQMPLGFGETFPDTWNTIWVPQKENSHLVFHVGGDMYAVIRDKAKDRASLVETPRTSPPDMTFSFGASEPKNYPRELATTDVQLWPFCI